MTKLTSIRIDDEFQAFIDKQIADGRFQTADDVVRAGLSLLREEDKNLEALRAALIEGEESGIMDEFDSTAFLLDMRRRHAL